MGKNFTNKKSQSCRASSKARKNQGYKENFKLGVDKTFFCGIILLEKSQKEVWHEKKN